MLLIFISPKNRKSPQSHFHFGQKVTKISAINGRKWKFGAVRREETDKKDLSFVNVSSSTTAVCKLGTEGVEGGPERRLISKALVGVMGSLRLDWEMVPQNQHNEAQGHVPQT